MNPTPEDMTAAAALAAVGGPHQYAIIELDAPPQGHHPGGYVCGPAGVVSWADPYYPAYELANVYAENARLAADNARLTAENAALFARMRELEAIVSAMVKK